MLLAWQVTSLIFFLIAILVTLPKNPSPYSGIYYLAAFILGTLCLILSVALVLSSPLPTS